MAARSEPASSPLDPDPRRPDPARELGAAQILAPLRRRFRPAWADALFGSAAPERRQALVGARLRAAAARRLAGAAEAWWPASSAPRRLPAALAWLESTRALPVLDVVGLVAVLSIVSASASAPLPGAPAAAFAIAVLVAMRLCGSYTDRLRANPLDTLGAMVASVSIGASAAMATAAAFGVSQQDSGLIIWLWLAAILALLTFRTVHYALQQFARRHGLPGRRTLILGAGEVGVRVARRLLQGPGYGLVPVGFLDVDPPPPDAVGDRPIPVIGAPSELAAIITQEDIEHVVVAFSTCPDPVVARAIRNCAPMGVSVSVVPRLFETINDHATYEPIGGLPVLTVAVTDRDGWRFAVKHTLDRVIAVGMLVALAPLIAGIACAVKLSSTGPVLFRQTRVGRDGRRFEMLKFRTMCGVDVAMPFTPLPGFAPGGVEGADRRTTIGRWLRRSSLDELPQLLNVLRGEMSLVGPRPERPAYVSAFGASVARYEERHRVRSGLTGLAQVCGLRGQCSLEDRVELDNYYIEHFGLMLDLRILVMTIVAILRPAD